MIQETRTIEIRLPKLHSGQLEAKKQFKRFNVLAIGRRFGKTYMAMTEICTRAINGQAVAYIAPKYTMSTKFFKSCARRLTPIVKSVNSKDYHIELITGGTITIFSMESISNIRGNEFDYVVMDEAAYMNNLLEEWNSAIRPTLIDRQGQALFISSPNGYNNFYDLFQKGNKEDGWFSIQMPSHKNPYLPLVELEAVKEAMPTEAYEREILAQFNDTSANIFKREWIQKVDSIPDELAISFGCDLAISKSSSGDFTCVCVMGHDSINNKFYILALHRSQMSFNEILSRITNMAEIYNPQIIAIESVAFQRVITDQLLETTTLPVVGIHPTVDKIQRALPLATRFEKGDVFILDTEAVDEEVYKELLAFPNPRSHDDCIDAMEMAFSALSQTKPFVFSI